MAEIPSSGLHIPDGLSHDITCHVVGNTHSWLQALAILIGFLASIIAAIIARYANINISKKKSTIDLIVKENSADYIAERKSYIALRDKGDLLKYVNDINFHRERTTILTVLNYYEAICVGIKNDCFCEKTFKDWKRSTLVSDWIDLAPFVASLRRYGNGDRSQIFVECGKMAEKWATPEEKRKFSF